MADTPLATCSGEEWTFNPAGMSPCEVGQKLAEVCSPGSFRLPALPPDTQYLGPTGSTQNSCRCSSVYYSLLSACAYCQGRSYIKWTAYKQNCTDVYLQKLLEPIPHDLLVPKWAFQNVEDADTFDVDLAKSTTGEESRNTFPKPPESSSLNVAAVAGGATGGAVFLIALGLVIYFFIRRRRRRKASANIDIFGVEAHRTGGSGPPPDPVFETHLTGTTAAATVQPKQIAKPLKLYNPDDPSTWPHNFSMYPDVPVSVISGRTNTRTTFSTSGFSSEYSEPILPNYTGVSSTTAVTQARTTMGDQRRYEEYEI